MLIDVRDGPKGKIVTFQITERRRVQIVDYRGSKALTTSTIEDELKKKEVALKIDSFYDPAKARKVEDVISGMLKEKGRQFGSVKHDAKNVGGAGVQVSFIIDDGPNAKVKNIEFEGNKLSTDGNLRAAMKKIKQAGFWNLSWLTGKTKYSDEKWSEDQENLRKPLPEQGLRDRHRGQARHRVLRRQVGLPEEEAREVDEDHGPGHGGASSTRVGKVEFKGLTVFKEEGIRPLFKLKSGEIYREKNLKKAYEKLRDFYGGQGYFQWTGFTERNPDPEKKVVDLVINMEEDKRYFVGRIKFTGNETTRDKVIRREVYLTEGEVFNTELLKLSIRRINQLGYFKPIEGAPQLAPSQQGEDKIDVTFKVEEQNRNQFTFGGGVSGLEGTFVNASFQTANFLGLGETFQVSAQSGKRTKNYQVAITEPYFLDRPITAGVDIYKRRLEYQTFAGQNIQGYIDDRLGTSFTTGVPLSRFSRVFLNYAYEIVKIENVAPSTNPFDPTIPDGVQPVLPGGHRQAPREPADAFDRLQHGRQPVHAARGHEDPDDLPGHGRTARRDAQLLPAGLRGDPLLPAPAQDRARPARPDRLGQAVLEHRAHQPDHGPRRSAVLSTLLHGRREPDPRLQPAHGRPARLLRHRRGGRQVPAAECGVLFRRFGPTAHAAVLRCRPELPGERGLRLQEAAHLHGRRGALHHAGAQRAVPSDLRVESQPRSVPAEIGVPLRRRHNLLRRGHEDAHPRLTLAAAALLVTAEDAQAQAKPEARGPKIAVIDMARIYSDSLLGKSYTTRIESLRNEIEAERTKKQSDLTKMDAAVKALQDDIEKQASVLSPEALEKKRQELVKKSRDRPGVPRGRPAGPAAHAGARAAAGADAAERVPGQDQAACRRDRQGEGPRHPARQRGRDDHEQGLRHLPGRDRQGRRRRARQPQAGGGGQAARRGAPRPRRRPTPTPNPQKP
jgi:hypothetical protein